MIRNLTPQIQTLFYNKIAKNFVSVKFLNKQINH